MPWASPETIGHGCNTPCVALTHESGETLVLDAGSGLVGVGEMLRGTPRTVPILMTHYHWDHMQGLPFFAPLYVPGGGATIWAPALGQADRSWVETIFRSPFFPIPYERLPSPPAVQLLQLGKAEIGPFRVSAILLNHPGGAFAFRITGSNGDLVYATDHELGDPRFDEPLTRFAAGAAALILDAHFTPDEGRAHRGWGHSTWAEAARFAAALRVGRLWLFHHKPGRSDVDLVDIEAEARNLFAATDAAGEGDTFEV